MDKARFGIIGLGNMGSIHARNIVNDNRPEMILGAVCDIAADKAKTFGTELNVPHFTDYRKMYASGLIDAVIIATPHYGHPGQAIRAARAGLHVLCEKPIAVAVGPARAMIAECAARKVAFGVMFQQRTRGIYMKMQELVASGQLGEISRVQMICSDWYRTQFYYDSGSWRGTWDGEGGGVLINQAPHSLDLFQWIGGMPSRVTAVVGTRVHKIEVENTANVICHYPGGKIGYIYATTAEAPGQNQLMVCGDRGTLVAEGKSLRFARLETPISEHLRTCQKSFERPKSQWEDVPYEEIDKAGDHVAVVRNFVDHLLRGQPLVCTGAEGINELELSNAVYLAGFGNRPIDLPVDAGQMDRLLAKLEKQFSTGRGGNLRRQAARDMRRLMKEGT